MSSCRLGTGILSGYCKNQCPGITGTIVRKLQDACTKPIRITNLSLNSHENHRIIIAHFTITQTSFIAIFSLPHPEAVHRNECNCIQLQILCLYVTLNQGGISWDRKINL